MSAPAEAAAEASSASTRVRLSWGQLPKRAFEIDMAFCSHCGGPVRLKFREELVIPTGGDYFFLPSISAVRAGLGA